MAGNHPNIKCVKAGKGNLIRVFNYVGKEGDVHGDLALGDLDPKSKRDEIFGGALAKESFDDFIATLKEEAPHDIVMGFNNVKAAGEFFFSHKEQLDMQSDKVFLDENLPQPLIDWRDTYIRNPNPPDRPKTLIMVGPSRLGKTQWARSLGNVCYWNNMIDLDLLCIKDRVAQRDYIVLDDVPGNKIGN